MDYPKYYGNYMGIVVQNNDPQYRGRVKVFVPHVTPTVYKNWTENSDQQPAVDRVFKFIGSNVGSDLTNIIDDLKQILPWAEVASPIAGESSAGRYHAASKKATTSDGSNFNYLFGDNSAQSPYQQNSDNIGEKPGHIYDMATVNLSDAFNNPQLTNVNNVNKLSYNYTPECYSNSGKGSFAIPNVGSHVWVFFNAGDPLKPVVFSASHGASEWNSIFDATVGQPGLDYPGEWENTTIGSGTINAETYRNKYVINQKGGTLAFVNTDNRELLKITHYSGSFKEFNNQANIELATGNDQKLVLGDMFETIRGTRNEFTQRDFDCVVAGDHYRKVGDLNSALYAQWKAIMDPIADIKQLFDIQRTNGIHENVASLLKLNGTGQTRAGQPEPCPVCAGGATTLAINNSFAPGYGASSNVADTSTIGGDGVGKYNFLNLSPTVVRGLIPTSPTALLGKLTSFITGLVNYQASTLSLVGANTPMVGHDGSTLQNAPGYPFGLPCPVCNNPKNPYPPTPGISPSSFNGIWTPEPKKIIDLPQLMTDAIPQLAKLEAQMGRGGSEIVEITKHKVETIGTVMNDWGAIRVDPLGKMEPAYVQVHPGATMLVRKPTPLIEQVQVDDLPGGTYSLNVCNRYSVLVGAGGLNLKSYGVVNISGAMTSIAGEQVNIGSANEVNVDGGKRLSLIGDIVHIKQRNNEQVLLDGDVGISGNLYIKGGVYIEHNLAAQQTDTPQKKRQTSAVTTRGGPTADMCTGVSIPMDTGGVVPDPTSRELTPAGAGVPVHMGYTDPGRYSGFVPTGTIVGYIPPNTCLVVGTGNLGYPVYSYNPAPIAVITPTGFCVAGTGPIGATGTLQATPGYVAPKAPISSPAPNDVTNAISLRGLTPAEVQLLHTAASIPESGGAPKFPIMNMGTGSHADAIVINAHTHDHDEGEVGSHMAVRQIAMQSLAATENNDFGPIKVAKDPSIISYLS